MSEGLATLTAWERWEMASIATPLPQQPAATVEEPAAPARPPVVVPVFAPIEPVRLFDEAELDRLRDQARCTGAAEGRAQGLAEGRIEGREAGLAEMQAQAERLRALAQGLPAALRCAERALAQDVLALAFEIGRQLAGAALKTEPGCVLAAVRDMLATEPAMTGAPRLLLHPGDAAVVREHLGPELQEAGWTVQPEPTLTPGGALVRSASGELDATVETRAQRVQAALGCRLRVPAPDHG